MSDVKRLEPLTGWITYELAETEYLAEPRLSVRLRLLDGLEAADELLKTGMSEPLAARALALMAVVEWDLTEVGKPIPVNAETKAIFLRPLLSDVVKPTQAEIEKATAEKKKPIGTPLAFAIANDAQNRKLFRKNL